KLKKSPENPAEVEGLPFTGYKGKLQTPLFKDVQFEYDRIDSLTRPNFQPRSLIHGQENNAVNFGSQRALEKFIFYLGNNSSLPITKELPKDNRSAFDTQERQKRQVKEIEDHVQWLMRDSDKERNRFFLYKVMPEFAERIWSTESYHPYYSPDRFIE